MPDALPNPDDAAPQPGVLQPDQQFVIATLQEELAQAHQNRIYLMSCLKQMQQEFAEQREMWQLERESLMKKADESSNDD